MDKIIEHYWKLFSPGERKYVTIMDIYKGLCLKNSMVPLLGNPTTNQQACQLAKKLIPLAVWSQAVQ